MTQKWYGRGIYSRTRKGKDGKPETVFYVRVTHEGEPVVFTAGGTEASADRERTRVRNDIPAAIAKRDKQRQQARGKYTVAELYRDFTSNYRGRGGTEYYLGILKGWMAYAGKKAAADVTASTVDAYRKRRRTERTRTGDRERVSKSTSCKEARAIKKMYKWAKIRGKVAINPLAEYETVGGHRVLPARALTRDEEGRMLAAMPPLERDIASLCLDTSMRRGEALTLTWACIDYDAGVIDVVATKTGSGRKIPMTLTRRISEVLGRRRVIEDGDLVFSLDGKPVGTDRLDRALRNGMKAAHIPRIRGSLWNTLRKTWVSRIYQNPKVMPQDEADWAGHSMAIANKHYRDYSVARRDISSGVLDYDEPKEKDQTVPITVTENTR